MRLRILRSRILKDERGHAMLEFGVASALLVGCLAGTWQFGYSFYVYNQLQSAINNGGMYAAMRTYRSQGTSDITTGKTKIKNMAVYGTPNPGTGAQPVVRGLTTSNIDVTYTLDSVTSTTTGITYEIPTAVTVSVTNFSVNAIFKTFTFTGKPSVTYPYLGRFAPNESEP